MNTKLTEEEMRLALFGSSAPPMPATNTHIQDTSPEAVFVQSTKTAKKIKTSKSFTPKIRVTLRVGNEFEGNMHELIHEADTLSTLIAEHEAIKTARKKFKFVEVVSVKPT